MNLKIPVHCFPGVIIWEGCSVCFMGFTLPPQISGWQWGRESEGRKVEQWKELFAQWGFLPRMADVERLHWGIQSAGKNSKSGG